MTQSQSPDAMLVESRDPRRWGTTLIGTGDIEVAAGALEKALKTAGMTCRRTVAAKGRIELVASQDAPWYKIIAQCLPQRACWLLLQEGHGQEIAGDFRSFLWHRWLVFTFVVAVLSGMSAIWLSELTTFEFVLEGTAFKELVLATVAAFIGLVYLLLGGAHHREDIWQTLLLEVEKSRGNLELKGRTVSRRNISVYSLLLTMALILGALVVNDVFDEKSTDVSFVTFVCLSAFFVAIVFLFATAGLMAHVHEANYRVDAIVTGLITLVAAFFFFAPTILWMAVGNSTDLSRRLNAIESETSPEMTSARASTPIPEEESNNFERRVIWRTQARQVLIVATSPFLAAIAFFVLMGVLKSSNLTRVLLRLREDRRQGAYKKATEGGSHLNYLRFLLGVTWTLMAAFVFSALSALAMTGVQAVDLSFPYPEADLVTLSAAVVRTAVGGLIDGAFLSGATRFAWILYASTGVVVFAISLSQLYLSRLAERRTLATAAASEPQEPERQARETLDRLACRAGLAGVKLAVLPSQKPGAAAQCFFRLTGRERFVIVTEGALVDFDQTELEAVLAHELVHLREGHCRKVNLLRWLGRLTFVGDGFVLALQDSFGYEKEADRLLLAKSWATPTALRRSLLIMLHAGPGWQGLGILGAAPAGAAGENPPDTAPKDPLREDLRTLLAGEKLSFSRRWRLSWHLFRQQYFAAQKFHYWHPSYQDRLDEVNVWCSKQALLQHLACSAARPLPGRLFETQSGQDARAPSLESYHSDLQF